jgi:hypothetical protein
MQASALGDDLVNVLSTTALHQCARDVDARGT